MKALLGGLYKLLCFIMVVFMIVMTLMVFVNTVLRYCTNTSIIFSEEISRFLFIWSIFLGGILAVADDIKKIGEYGLEVLYPEDLNMKPWEDRVMSGMISFLEKLPKAMKWLKPIQDAATK